MIIAALLLMPAEPIVTPTGEPAVEASACRVLHGGIADGMCMGAVDPYAGAVLVSLLPAPEAGPPIAPDTLKIVHRLLRAHGRANGKLPRRLLAEGATTRFCTDWTEQCMKSAPLTAWPLPIHYAPNRPYLLPDGSIRIEWMLGVKLDYMSMIVFEGEKVKSIDTMPATIPMARPPSTP